MPVYIAHVPVVYQVPAPIMQPFVLPFTGVTGIVPLPTKGVEDIVLDGPTCVIVVEVLVLVAFVEVDVGLGFADLGRYFNVAGQSYGEPTARSRLKT